MVLNYIICPERTTLPFSQFDSLLDVQKHGSSNSRWWVATGSPAFPGFLIAVGVVPVWRVRKCGKEVPLHKERNWKISGRALLRLLTDQSIDSQHNKGTRKHKHLFPLFSSVPRLSHDIHCTRVCRIRRIYQITPEQHNLVYKPDLLRQWSRNVGLNQSQLSCSGMQSRGGRYPRRSKPIDRMWYRNTHSFYVAMYDSFRVKILNTLCYF